MDMTCDKLLVISDKRLKKIILEAAEAVPGLGILETDSENRAFELIYSHNFVLTIVDETLEHIDIYKIGAMLISHQAVYDTPLLVITDDLRPDRFLTDFNALQTDFIQKPFSEKLIQARLKFFYELFKHKNAVSESMNELDQAYSKLVEQNERIMHSELIRKKLAYKSHMAAVQMNQAIPGLKNAIHQLSHQKLIKPQAQAGLGSLKRISKTISQISGKLLGLKEAVIEHNPLSARREKVLTLLYVQRSDEEFNMLDQCIKNTVPYTLFRARATEEAVAHIARNTFDVVIIDHMPPAASGFDLLSRLRQTKSDIPVIFALSRPYIREGSKAMARGALNFFIKEEMTTGSLLSIIDNTLEKSIIGRQAEDAANRIIMVARKDTVTNLFSRTYFDKNLEEEISRSRRYKTALSVMIIHFNTLEEIRDGNDSATRNALLNESSGLIQSSIRTGDTACRFENEKFSIILPHTDIEGAGIMAHRISRRISEYQFTNQSKPFKQTTSIGAAQFDADKKMTGSHLSGCALKALAAAIKKGQNKIELYPRDHH